MFKILTKQHIKKPYNSKRVDTIYEIFEAGNV